MRTLKTSGDLFGRGVYLAPWQGPNGELVLLAITHERKLVCPPRVIPDGASHILAGDEMWDLLERSDPQRTLKAI